MEISIMSMSLDWHAEGAGDWHVEFYTSYINLFKLLNNVEFYTFYIKLQNN